MPYPDDSDIVGLQCRIANLAHRVEKLEKSNSNDLNHKQHMRMQRDIRENHRIARGAMTCSSHNKADIADIKTYLKMPTPKEKRNAKRNAERKKARMGTLGDRIAAGRRDRVDVGATGKD